MPRPLTGKCANIWSEARACTASTSKLWPRWSLIFIVTQDLCHVCAATPDDLASALIHLRRAPQIVTLNPHSLKDVCADIRKVGEATGCGEQAEKLIAKSDEAIAAVERRVANLPRPRVLALEWLDPLYVAGHWVPEMIERAGGLDVLGRARRTFVPRGMGYGGGHSAGSDRDHALRVQHGTSGRRISRVDVAPALARFTRGEK